MKVDLVKWELGKLLDAQHDLRLAGRPTDYQTDGRIDKLQKFLDSQVEENDKNPEFEQTKVVPY